MRNERVLMWAIAGGLAALIGWNWWTNTQDYQRRGGTGYVRKVAQSAIYGAALDAGLGVRTPLEIKHWGPGICPPHWVPHKLSYPTTPGLEMQRLIYGAPMASNVTTPAADRPWLFNPPSEVDM